MEPTKVLAVDDSALMHRIYEIMLRDHAVIHASDGREALSRLDEHPDIDLILLDINMPNMNGFEFLDALRSDGRLARTHVIIITTEGKSENASRGLELGAAAYLTKPFRSEEIREVITKLETVTAP